MSWKNTGQTDEFKIWSDVCLYMIIPSNRMIIYHPSPFWKKSKATLLWYFEIAMEIALLVRWFTYAMWFLSKARCSKLPKGIHHIVPNYHITGDTSNEIHSTYYIHMTSIYGHYSSHILAIPSNTVVTSYKNHVDMLVQHIPLFSIIPTKSLFSMVKSHCYPIILPYWEKWGV